MTATNLARTWLVGLAVAVLAACLLIGGGAASAAKPKSKHPNLKGAEPGAFADSVATKITDPSTAKLIWNLIKEDAAGPSIGDVLRELAVINKKLDVLDRKLDGIAADVAEIRTNQYWIELQKYMGAISYVQEELADIGKEEDVEVRQARSRVLAQYIQTNLTPFRKPFQNFVLAVPGGRKGIIPALSDQQKLGLRFWGAKETQNLIEAYDAYAAFQALLAVEIAQAKIALAATPAQREKAEADAKELGKETKETIAKQVAELPKGMAGTTSWQVDLETRLAWFARPGAAPDDWGQAVAAVAQSRAGGFSNWRMPSDPEYDGLGPCPQRNFKQPCAFATFLSKRGWKLPTSCNGRNIWWTSTLQGGRPAGFIWTDVPAMQGQTAHSPGVACVLQVRGVGAGESYWM
jgi:hypothetical protein